MKRFAILLCVFAALPALAHTVIFDIDGKKVQVEVKTPASQTLTDGGRSVLTWSPEDSAAIAGALVEKDLAWAVPQTLGALHQADHSPVCMSLDLEDYGTVNVTLPGKIDTDAHGRAVWSPGQI